VVDLQGEPVLDAHATLAEGPLWDPARSVLWWVDILAGQVHAFDPLRGKDTRYDVGSMVGAVALRHDGSLLAALQDGFVTLDPATGRTAPFLSLAPEPIPRRANDGKCDPQGRFLIGRVSLDEAPGTGTLHRLDPDRSLARLADGLTIPNGMAWHSDGRTFYFIDSPRKEVTVHEYGSAAVGLGPGRALVRFDGEALPDGMTIDAEDCLWIALWGGSRVVRVSPDGAVLATVHLPASLVTSCTFGGEALDELFITTARKAFGPADDLREPLAGGLFRVRPGTRGLAAVPFAG
jgi:sugar lactone lactonase YvrE